MAAGVGDEGVLKKLLAQMNSHVPSRRSWLSELLSMREPSVRGRDGRDYVIHRSELEKVKAILLEHGLSDIKLPILLMADTTMSNPMWRIEGREECSVIAHILGRAQAEPPDRLILYTPHISIVIRELPTAATCMYLA